MRQLANLTINMINKSDIQISKIEINAVELLRAISIQTFKETFAHQNTESDMQLYVSENLSLDKLQQELNNPDSEFYFIYCNNELAGYLKINFGKAQTELKDEKALEIERIYVLQQFQGKQLGQALMHKAIDITKQQKCPYLWLGVWEKNTKAISFYLKQGFIEFDKHVFKLGSDVQTDILMKLML